MGLRRSLTRDSAMSADNLYSSLASSCSRRCVDFLTLQKESCAYTHDRGRLTTFFMSTYSMTAGKEQQRREDSPAALSQRHQDGQLIMGVLPKAGVKNNTILLIVEVVT